MAQGTEPPQRITSPSRLFTGLIGALGIVLVVLTLATFKVQLQHNITPARTVGCLRDRPSGAKALVKNLKELRTGSIQCGQQPHADLEWIQGPEGQAGGGHTCVGFEKVCVDQGAIVMHSDRYVVNGTEFDMPTFDVTDLTVCPYTCCLGTLKIPDYHVLGVRFKEVSQWGGGGGTIVSLACVH
jgi:hypothetical protein